MERASYEDPHYASYFSLPPVPKFVGFKDIPCMKFSHGIL